MSALTFLFIGLSCFSVYLSSGRRVWYFLALVFLFFSMDDATSFHERVSGFFQDNTTLLSFFPSYVWVLLYAPFLFFSLSALVYLLWRECSRELRYAIVVAVFLIGFAVFLDLVDGVMQKNSGIVFLFGCFLLYDCFASYAVV